MAKEKQVMVSLLLEPDEAKIIKYMAELEGGNVTSYIRTSVFAEFDRKVDAYIYRNGRRKKDSRVCTG